MRNKTKRILAVRKLIESESISSQEELMFRLKEMGINATQSTLSRDLNFIKASKRPHIGKGYIYVLPEKREEKKEDITSATITDAVLRIEFAGNIAVIKTLSGYANAVTVLIDSKNFLEILGTIAGEDTIIIIMRDGISRQQLVDSLSTVLPNIQSLCK